MIPGVNDAMVLAEQLVLGKFGNLAELLIGVGDASTRVGGGNNGMGIDRHESATGNFSLYSVGDWPAIFLKMRLKWVSDWKPTA